MAPTGLRPRFAILVFKACLVLVFLSLALLLGAKWMGNNLSNGGHTASTDLHEIVIGNEVLQVPANAIRFRSERRDGLAERLDLYLHWPELEGYTDAIRDAFNHIDGSRQLIFISYERRMMSRDMSARFEPVYAHVIEPSPVAGPSGIDFYRFKAASGYSGEVLAVAEDEIAGRPFVARCLTGEAARQSLAPCERDVAVGDDLSLIYRFPAGLLTDWQILDAAVQAKALSYIRTLN